MKSIIIMFFALSSVLMANNQAYKDKLGKLISEKTKRDIAVEKVFDFNGSKELKTVILHDKKDDAKIAVLATQDGNIVIGLSNVFLSNNEKDLATLTEAYQLTQPKHTSPKPEVLDKLFSSLSKDRFVHLKSKNKDSKQTFYLVLDPRCPGCRREVGEIPNKLKVGDVKLLFVSFLGEESAYKAKLIYSKVKNIQDDSQKLKMIERIYDPSYQLTSSDKKQDVSMIEQNTQDVSQAGIQSVPFEHIMKK